MLAERLLVLAQRLLVPCSTAASACSTADLERVLPKDAPEPAGGWSYDPETSERLQVRETLHRLQDPPPRTSWPACVWILKS